MSEALWETACATCGRKGLAPAGKYQSAAGRWILERLPTECPECKHERLTNPQPCDKGVCAAPKGHFGTCEEASGWQQ